MKFLPFLVLAYLLSLSCERHEFVNEDGTGTKQLHEAHGSHSAGDESGGHSH
jgi:hypothetical protein